VKTSIIGATVVFEDGARPATVVIAEDGTIDGVVGFNAATDGTDVIDASGLYLFPGAVDPHSHLNDPGATESEDFFTGTCGAAAGGVTTVIEMPQTVPIVINSDRFLEKREIAQGKAVVDFALWGALTAENVGEGGSALRELAESGAIAFKAFTSDSPEQPRLPDTLFAEAMGVVTELDLLVGVHCEDQPLIDYFTTKLKLAGRNDAFVNPDSRPPIAEVEAARRVMLLAELVGARVHLAHVSHPDTFGLVHEARKRGVDVTAETCPHYLALSRDDIARVDSYGMCNPPLRDEPARRELWVLLRNGLIDCVGSDHCAYTQEEKANPNYWEMPAGISGMQIMFPLIVGEAASQGIPLSLLARMFSGAPSRRFGLADRKGSIKPGLDADLVLVDLDSTWQVRGAELFSKAPGTAFEGADVKAKVVRTLVRGRTVFEANGQRGRIAVEPGFGRFQRPSAQMTV